MAYGYTNTAATTAAVTNRFVTIASMKVGTYTIANASPVWSGGCLVTITHTIQDTVDTLGTVTIVGTDLAGAPVSEVLTPSNGTTVSGSKIFRSVTSATGAGWVQGGTTADQIVVGCAAGNIVCGSEGQLGGVIVNNTVAASVTISDARGTILTIPASQAAGTYYNLGGVAYSGFLKVATTNTNDVTVFHTGTMPSSYAM